MKCHAGSLALMRGRHVTYPRSVWRRPRRAWLAILGATARDGSPSETS